MKPLIVGLAVAGLYLGALSMASVYNVVQAKENRPLTARADSGTGVYAPIVAPTVASRALFRPPLTLAPSPSASPQPTAPTDPRSMVAARATTSPSAIGDAPQGASVATRSGAEGSAVNPTDPNVVEGTADTQSPDAETDPSSASGPSAQYLALRHAIEWCESRLDPTAKNPHSTASGIAQFLDSTWAEVTGLKPPARAYPLAVQQAAFDKLFAAQGAAPWYSSRSCWSALIEGAK